MIVVPAAAGLVLASILVGPGTIRNELHLVAPARASPGATIPLRALLYAGIERPEGPQLQQQPIRVAWTRGGAHVSLRPGAFGSMEGSIEVPEGARGARLRLRAEAQLEGATVRVERSVELGAAPAPARPSPRELPPLARLSLGPLRELASAGAAGAREDRLQLQVAGGACAPEHPCELLVHVGAPPAAARLLPSPSASVREAGPPAATEGVARLEVVTHGPEAQVQLIAQRDGIEVARRAVRLPLSLAMPQAVLEGPRVRAPGAVPLGLAGGERGCIVDVFDRDGRWLRTRSLPVCDGSERVAMGDLRGIVRLQLRRDPFAAKAAAVRTLYLRDAGEADAEVRAELARAALRRAPHDAWAARVAADPSAVPGDPVTATDYLLALLDGGLLHPPAAVSGYPAARAALEVRRARVRGLAPWVLSLGGLLLALLLSLRALRAGAEAAAIMRAAGEGGPALARQRLRRGLRLATMAVSLLLAFAAIAMYVIARASGP